VVDREKPGLDSRGEGKHTGRNDLSHIIMYDVERVLKSLKADKSLLGIVRCVGILQWTDEAVGEPRPCYAA